VSLVVHGGNLAIPSPPERSGAIEASILDLIARHGVLIAALVIFAGELGLPTGIPAEIALMIAGAYGIHSPAGLVGGLLLVAAGDLLGTMTLFLAIRTGGVRLVSIIRKRAGADPASEDVFTRIRRRLHGHDSLAVFVGRLLPLVRMPVTIWAGLSRMPVRAFVVGAAPAGAIWAGLPIALGYALRVHVHAIAERYTNASHILLIISPAVGLIIAAVTWIRRGKTSLSRLRRGRALAGFAIAAATVVYLGTIAWHELGRRPVPVMLPKPVLYFWLGALGVLAVALVGIAVVDFQRARSLQPTHRSESEALLTESVLSSAWVGLVLAIGVVILLIEHRYPTI
jgi:membrane protein DedA with SNARE-associated domain